MIETMKGNILKNNAEALVNTVNLEGYMGKGIALQFKKAFPDNFKEYSSACRKGEIAIGKVLVHETHDMFNPKFIINFPTKNKWRKKSDMRYIEEGLIDLVRQVKRLGIGSIAIPPLGCGLGGLNWPEVKRRIVDAFNEVPGVQVILYEPGKAPDAKELPNRTVKPDLTPARAMFIFLIKQYMELSYELTRLEVQKMAYFLQEAGEPLRLKYSKSFYGPYAANLKNVLELLDGHFIRISGLYNKPTDRIALIEPQASEAETYLSNIDPESRHRLDRVSKLILGYETPYSMELLSSVHWLAVNDSEPARTEDEAIKKLHAWNKRKKNIFRPDHIRIAWRHLVEEGWIKP